MPLYEYACRTCNSRFEVKQSYSEPPLSAHDGCGGQLTKVFQPVGIVFKGSGWYITDSRSTPSESSSSSSSSSSESKSETKAA